MVFLRHCSDHGGHSLALNMSWPVLEGVIGETHEPERICNLPEGVNPTSGYQ